MLKGITGLAMFVAAIAVALGLVLGGFEFLNPNLGKARADRMNEETAALASKNAYEQSLREIELEKQRALAQRELEWYDRKMAMAEDAASLLVLGLAAGIVLLGFGGSVYLASLGFDILRRRGRSSQGTAARTPNVLPFPTDPTQHFRRQERHLPQGTT